MKLLLTADTVGGVWTYALDLCRALLSHDVQVALATMGAPPTPLMRQEAGRLPNVELHESRYKLEWMDDPWSDVQAAGDWLLELARKFEPDIVHLNGYAHAALAWRVPKVVVAHSCVLTWWRAVKGCDAPATFDTYRDEVTRGLHAADAIVAPSQAMLDALQGAYGPLPRARVIYNGRPAPRADVECARKEEFVFAAGRIWDEAKNIGALAEAAGAVAWPICVAGEDRHPDNKSARASVANSGALRPLGRLEAPAMAAWFSRASIYALPARYEPFGLTALEGAQARCALVLGDIPSLREIWSDAACFVDPNDPRALALALNDLIHDSALRSQMSGRALERAARYSLHGMGSQYMSVYRELRDAIADPRVLQRTRAACAS